MPDDTEVTGDELEDTVDDEGRADPDARDGGTDIHQEEAYDAEEPAAEWHVWLGGILVVVGLAILFAPEGMLPEVAVGLAPILVAVAVVGFVGQWAYRHYR
jgi:hypothetical protein